MMQGICWRLLLMFSIIFSILANAAAPLRVGLGVSDQVYKNPTPQSSYERLLVDELLKTLQLPHQIIKAPHARLRQMLQDGDLDLAVRQQDPAQIGILLSSPYVRIRNKAFARADFRGRLRSIADVANFRVIGFQNANHVLGPMYAAAISRSPEYRELTDHTQAVLMLLKQRAELLVINENTLDNVLTTLGRSRAELREYDLFAVTEFRLGSRDAALINQISQLLDLWQQNGLLRQLQQQSQELRKIRQAEPATLHDHAAVPIPQLD